ncbi:MAG: pre-peptidase C-terminal domain-containing protein [Gemmobacter sp.]|uniref:calcium-binding protein n=1 Tax=Gemmobacter sp. TaxID=1898957 RepID=UPI001A41BF84|nr:calcium-binding protein [Gemmobacter sp.]MBL8562232.1 pre-peptidase C-terminal domain-containing protein [Gemmobacter sp.]
MPDVPGGITSTYTLPTNGLLNDPNITVLEADDDVDYFRITLTAGMTYDFMLNALATGGADMQFQLMNALNAGLSSNWNDGNRFGFTATETGTYYIAIRDTYSYDDAGEGGYAITVTGNDDVASTMAATTTSITASGNSSWTLGQATDEDWFRVTLRAGYSHDFRLAAGTAGGADMRLEVYDSLGNRITYDTDGGSVSLSPTEGGTYFIRVMDEYDYDQSAEGTYTITASLNDDVMDSDASMAAITSSGDLTRTLGQSNDEDWFRVTMRAGYAYDFSLTAASAGGADMRIEIYDSLGNRLTYDTDGGTVGVTPSAGGTYFIRVLDEYSYDDAAEGSYTITSRLNDTILGSAATTNVIAGSGTIASDLAQSNDADWFRVSLVAGRSYGFALAGDGGALSLDDGTVEIRDANGALIDTDYTGGTATVTPATGGTYYIVVKDGDIYDDRGEGNYRLTAQMSDTVVSNTTTTARLALNGSVASAVDAPHDTDWFRVSLQQGLSYGFTITGTGTTRLSDPDIYLRDTNGADILVWGDNNVNPSSTISWTADQAGTYFVQAGNINETDRGSYRIVSVATDTVRNDTRTAAQVLDGERISGKVDVSGDADWYGVRLVAGREYTFTLAGNGAAPRLGDRTLGLYDETGTLVTSYSSSGSQASVITFEATESGTYYLGARGFSDSTGNFTLTVLSDALRFVGNGAANVLTGNRLANVMLGNGGADVISGQAGNDLLKGGLGKDLLRGDTGRDKLFGEAGADTLSGGAGNDQLTGGGGTDRFVFARNGDDDVIRDFANDVDTISLVGLGVRTVTQALARAVQLGDDVLFDFGRGDTLRVEDTTLSALRDDLVFG